MADYLKQKRLNGENLDKGHKIVETSLLSNSTIESLESAFKCFLGVLQRGQENGITKLQRMFTSECLQNQE